MLKSLILSIVLILQWADFALATSAKNTIQTTKKNKRITIGANMGGTSLSTSQDSVFGVTLNLSLKYAFNEDWGTLFEVSQAYDSDGFENIYTALSAKLSYSLIGSQLRAGQEMEVSGLSVGSFSDYPSSGLFVDASVKQAFFNGSLRALPLVGPGLDLRYQLGSSQNISYQIGVGADHLTNGSEEDVTPLRMSVGLIYWL